jgi:hypothetical protein
MAAAIALLQAAPIRLKNLTALDVDKNLIARGNRLYLVIPEDEVKNHEPIDFELPAETRDILAWYVREHRPSMLREPSGALFPGKGTKAKSSGALASQIVRTVFRYTGLRFNTHLFRHAAGKIFLDARPGQYEVLRRVLGHRAIATTTSLYAGAETRSAGSHFAAVIAAYIDNLVGLNNSTATILARLQELGEAAKIMGPERSWAFINALASRIRARHRPARDKRNLKLSEELLDLGLNIIEKATATTGLKAAILHRDGLMIALLTLVPLRRRNLAGLRLDWNVLEINGSWLISLAASETKTHAPFEILWPSELLAPLHTYLNVHRPRLSAMNGRWAKRQERAVGFYGRLADDRDGDIRSYSCPHTACIRCTNQPTPFS